jgi:hypothetical protein
MAFREEWAPTGSPLTIEALYAQGRHQFFQYGARIYVGFGGVDNSETSGECYYLAIEHNASAPTRFVGSTLVTPVSATVTPL